MPTNIKLNETIVAPAKPPPRAILDGWITWIVVFP